MKKISEWTVTGRGSIVKVRGPFQDLSRGPLTHVTVGTASGPLAELTVETIRELQGVLAEVLGTLSSQ
jgi:hypothetical protein